ncbi:MAG: porin [Chitinophaga sp.]
MKKILPIAAGVMFCLHATAQDQPEKKEPKLTISGYAEAYYSYDFNQPENHTRPGFLYNHTRHNELNINLAFLKANYSSGRVRANVAVMAGTYAQYNLAAEQELLRHVYEANVGVRAGDNVWIDAGIMPSHIGLESAVSKDCYTLTRSIMAENTPYYETGTKVTWSPDEKWTISAMYLNGWQRMKRPDANQTPAFGTQLTFRPGSRVTLNWSTFLGNDKPDSVRRMRYFNDVYGIFNIMDKFTLVAACDYGVEKKQEGESGVSSWYSSMAVARYAFTEKVAMAVRYEYYDDENGVIIATGTPNGFSTSGYSVNLDVAPAANVLFRIEGKWYNGKDDIFTKGPETKNSNVAVTTSLAVSF